MPRQKLMEPKERPESDSEFHQRVQDQMDEDSWAGRSTVGASFPTRATIVEYPAMDEHQRIYRVGARKNGDGH